MQRGGGPEMAPPQPPTPLRKLRPQRAHSRHRARRERHLASRAGASAIATRPRKRNEANAVNRSPGANTPAAETPNAVESDRKAPCRRISEPGAPPPGYSDSPAAVRKPGREALRRAAKRAR